MRKVATMIMAGLFFCASVYAYDDHRKVHHFSGDDRDYDRSFACLLDQVDFDLDDGTIIMEGRGSDAGKVEITPKHELYVNGELVKLDDNQQKLVSGFYIQTYDLIDSAKAIGLAGAKLGAQGAAVGIHALAKLFKLLESDYDSEDYEREIESRAQEIEDKADLLEDRADKIEDMADELEDLFYEMSDKIPAMKELGWSFSEAPDMRTLASPPEAPARPASPAPPATPRIPN